MKQPVLTLARGLSRLKQGDDSLHWRTRVQITNLACTALREDRDRADALAVAQLLVKDPSWNVRKAVADLLPYVSEEHFPALAAKLTEDSHALVRKSALRALEQRRREAKVEARKRRGMQNVATDLERIERIHGGLAASKARKVLERSYELALGPAVHDMRRLLSPIARTIASLCEHCEQGELNQEVLQSGLQHVRTRLDLMQRLVNDLHAMSQDLSKERQWHQLDEVVKEAHSAAIDALETEGRDLDAVALSLDVPNDLRVEISRHQIMFATTNVIHNAYHAILDDDGRTRPGEIRITARALDKERVQITVTDNGMGMVEEDAQEAFLPGRTTKMDRGTGHGLAIAKRNIEAHAGTIRLESKVDHGTTVLITLPIEAPEDEDE